MYDFMKSKNDLEDSYIIPDNLFDKKKTFIVIKIPFCDQNEEH